MYFVKFEYYRVVSVEKMEVIWNRTLTEMATLFYKNGRKWYECEKFKFWDNTSNDYHWKNVCLAFNTWIKDILMALMLLIIELW